MAAIYFIAGASGSGKSAVIPILKNILGDSVSIHDFDDIGVPEGADKKWRQESTEKWLQRLLKENKDACLLGQMVLGEILACPSAAQLKQVHFCLLDVSDVERIRRLKKRNTYGADQNMLNWASWLRMHHRDPQWMPGVIQEGAWESLNFKRLSKITSWNSMADIRCLDTTVLNLDEVAVQIKQWVQQED